MALNEKELTDLHSEKSAVLKEMLKSRDAVFENYKKEHGKLQLFFDELTSLVEPVRPVKMRYTKGTRGEKSYHVAMQVSDAHMGAVQEADEIEGFGEYNPLISDRRQIDYATRVLKWVQKKRMAYKVGELSILATGDLLCFPSGTMITLSNGSVKNIEDVMVGDEILSDPEPRKVLALHCRDKKSDERILQVKTCKGLPLIATSGHVVKRIKREYLETGWNPGGKKAIPFVIRDKTELHDSFIDECPLDNLRLGDYLISNPFRKTDSDEYINITAITELPLAQTGEYLTLPIRGTSPAVISNDNIQIDNDFLWMLGLFLAEGSFGTGHNKNHINSAIITLHIDEIGLSKKFSQIILKYFGYDTKETENQSHHTRCVCINNRIIATLIYKLCGDGVMNKIIHNAIYNMNRSLLPLVAGWLDGDGGFNPRRQCVEGVSVNPTLANQICNILLSEHISYSILKDTHGRHRPAYRIAITGEGYQLITSYSVSYNPMLAKPTYEDGLWIGSCYARRIISIQAVDIESKLYDLTIEGNHYYQANGYVVHNSGDIHDELRITNAFPVTMQIIRAADIFAKQVLLLAPEFNKINIHYIGADNHGRLTKKPQAKEEGMNNYNYLVGHIASLHLKAQPNVEFNLYPMHEKVVQCGSRQYLLAHGHGIKGWMGIPWYSIERKQNREARARMQIIMDSVDNELKMMKSIGFHKFVFGHYHTPINTPQYSCSGSVQGTDAYDHQNGRHADPSQSAWMIHPDKGMGEFDRIDFNLKFS
jgi:hypothetical protein